MRSIKLTKHLALINEPPVRQRTMALKKKKTLLIKSRKHTRNTSELPLKLLAKASAKHAELADFKDNKLAQSAIF